VPFVVDDIIVALAMTGVSAAVSYASAPRPDDTAEGLNNDLPTTEDGKVIPMVFGRARLDGVNVLGYGDKTRHGIIANGGK
jgi:hypothetical protein